MGGKDSASPSTSFTVMSQLTPLIYPTSDFTAEYLNDDGFEIELKYYIPLFTILINGGKGIGTGYSTDIPNYDPQM